ncbi:MAG: hypothetical protein NC452_06415 [Eubacterium sp.]|nr:hypothetical protein [Eubacterium sp.]
MEFNLTFGEMLFYGGIIGMIIVVLMAIIVIIVLANGKKRMRCKFKSETQNKN